MRPNARTKLNSAYMIGNAAIAATIGAVANSWTVFLVVFIGLAVTSLHAGNIRLTGKR